MSMAFWLAAPEPEIARTAIMFGARGPLRGPAPVSTRCTEDPVHPDEDSKRGKSGAILRDEVALLHAACREQVGTVHLALKNAVATQGVVTRSSRRAGLTAVLGPRLRQKARFKLREPRQRRPSESFRQPSAGFRTLVAAALRLLAAISRCCPPPALSLVLPFSCSQLMY
jgi:hypothetical protein